MITIFSNLISGMFPETFLVFTSMFFLIIHSASLIIVLAVFKCYIHTFHYVATDGTLVPSPKQVNT